MTPSRRIFITGGASGLGRALALRYARAGWRVLIGDLDLARGEQVLGELRGLGAAGGEAAFLACDVREEAALEAAADWLDAHWGGVDVVVNNAGVAVAGGIAETTIEDWRWILDINLLGVVRGCKVFAPRLRRYGGGHLVNIASMAGLVHPPQMSAYNATKAAVVALSETLELELAPDKIKVTVVCPAFFKTNLSETMRAGNPEVERLTRKLVAGSRRSAEAIAELVFQGVSRGDFHVLTHREGHVAWLTKRLLPHGSYRRLFALGTDKLMKR